MGIFDIFKTKVNEAAEKAGDVEGRAEEKAPDTMDKKKGGAADDPSAQAPAQPPTSARPAAGAGAGVQAEASDMVSEGAPVAQTGEAAPGAGDDVQAQAAPDSGMTQSIKDNLARGADKAGEMAEGATGNRFDEKIDSGVQQAEDKLG
jgi:hypothetical protein